MSGGADQGTMKKMMGQMGFGGAPQTPTQPNGAPPKGPAGTAMNPMEGFRKEAPPAPTQNNPAMGGGDYQPMMPYGNSMQNQQAGAMSPDKKKVGGK